MTEFETLKKIRDEYAFFIGQFAVVDNYKNEKVSCKICYFTSPSHQEFKYSLLCLDVEEVEAKIKILDKIIKKMEEEII